ncbi:DUF6397 family protein [Streptomyces winkii]|uniref:DUF6397 family protein n=1 Tax=Streptomyces winkii TaxID=3051178 RepID=UPI0028D19697|nr:DUF6397 family protein [Streptomyces sp. DSM 40971]
MSTAARELGLSPGAMALAVELGEVRTVRGARTASADPAVPVGPAWSGAGAAAAEGPPRRRVPRAELERLRAAEDFPDGLRERLRVVDAGGGAQLLGITASRFARLARGGCFSPVRFYVNRYLTVVWLYPARELSAFAESRPELLSGRLPRGLRMLLAEGVDLRAGHWRGRRVGRLCRQADGPWEAAAARAAVLDDDVLAEAVPDAAERARLRALKPELVPLRGRSAVVREVAEELCTATAEDEVFWQRLMLAADLESARAEDRPTGRAMVPRPGGSGGPGGLLGAVDALGTVGSASGTGGPGGCPQGKARAARHAERGRLPGDAAVRAKAHAVVDRARVLNALRAARQCPTPRHRDPALLRASVPGVSRRAF